MVIDKTKQNVFGGTVAMVSVLAFNSDDLSLNPAKALSFFSVKFVFKKNDLSCLLLLKIQNFCFKIASAFLTLLSWKNM